MKYGELLIIVYTHTLYTCIVYQYICIYEKHVIVYIYRYNKIFLQDMNYFK